MLKSFKLINNIGNKLYKLTESYIINIPIFPKVLLMPGEIKCVIIKKFDESDNLTIKNTQTITTLQKENKKIIIKNTRS